MKGTITYLLILGIAVGFYFLSVRTHPRQVDWTVTLSAKDKIPFGAYILRRELPGLFPGAKVEDTHLPIYNTVGHDTGSRSLYIYVGTMLSITKTDFDALLGFIRRGNDVFFAAAYLPDALQDRFNLQVQFLDSLKSDQVSAAFYSPAQGKAFTSDKQIFSAYFNRYDKKQVEILGYISGQKINFLRFKVGKGYLYVHSCPKIFSNYFLLQRGNSEYMPRAFATISAPKRIYWDEYDHGDNPEKRSVLSFILSDISLKTAYAGTVCLLILFVLFEIKRRERFIPVIEPLQNQTLAFVETVSLLYFNQKNNRDIAQKIGGQVIEFIQRNYFISTIERGEEFIALLASKSGLSKDFLYALLAQIAEIQDQAGVLTDSDLLNFNGQIEKFYSQAKT